LTLRRTTVACGGPQATTTTSSPVWAPIRFSVAPKTMTEAPVKPVVISTRVVDRSAVSSGVVAGACARAAGAASSTTSNASHGIVLRADTTGEGAGRVIAPARW
jgi:adenine deaminase